MRRRALAGVAVLLAVTAIVWAQPPSPPFPDARATDPAAMGWMVGAPPPADKMVRFADGSFYRFPRTRWAFSHMRELVPTVVVPRGAPASVVRRTGYPQAEQFASIYILNPPDMLQAFTNHGLEALKAASHGA